MKKAFNFLPSIVLLVFIFAMSILFFALPKKEYSSSEKRYLAESPTLSTDSFFSGDFGEDFEVYLSDHTPFRHFWVGLNSYYNLSLGNPLSNGIYHCKNGYLVNDPPVTDMLHKNIETIAQFSDKCGIKSTMLLAPSTGYVSNDVLPNKHIIYKDDEHFDKIADTFSNSIVEFVDVRDSFKSAYDGGTQVYYKTDHHWTTQGAYIAYTHLGDALGFKPYNKSNYEITEHEGFYGTTYSSSGYWFTKPDTIELWKCNALNDYTVTINDGGKTTESSSLFFTDHLKEDDKYPVYLDGNHPYTCIKNNTIKSDEKLLVIKDSFAHSLVPFLADHYSEIVMIDLRYYKEDVSKLIESEKFDQMLFLYSIDNLATDTNVSWLK